MSDNYLVIGGEGFLGRWVVEMLLKRGEKNVSVFDIAQRYFDKEVTYYEGNLSNYNDIDDAIRKSNATSVFHTASPHYGGAPKELFWKVNVDGTKNVIDSCVANGVKKIVYTSSSSVIYDGINEIVNADETTPYPEIPMDVYNETKAKGERLIIEANGTNGLLTCAVRPSSIFGPNDKQFLPAALNVMRQGQTKFQIGDNSNLIDWTYVENVSHAHLLASDKLFDGSPVAGEVFIITNDTPVPFWDLLRFVWAQFGHYPPYIIKFPKSAGFIIASLAELASYFTGKEPGFTRQRVRYSCNNRYFNIDKAKKLLGYEPIVDLEEGVKRACQSVK
ncbi:20022_t:CDS:2 [Gigaspora margarita]|uniref:20022_t:CDS:1 n=1 Tax=Gigaspora margarita TaxID=4874 RepID=A0ABN7VJ05_GIGMA|nr:20022_t:CDS:2 [Gigaspora margarita]